MWTLAYRPEVEYDLVAGQDWYDENQLSSIAANLPGIGVSTQKYKSQLPKSCPADSSPRSLPSC